MLTLLRSENTDDGVFGVLRGVPHLEAPLYTVEEEWRNNQRRVSCIPAGKYRLVRTVYHRHGYETFEVTNVPGRTRILIHPANTEEDVEGCIGLGLRKGTMSRLDEEKKIMRVKGAVLESKKAFALFMAAMTGINETELLVEWTH